MECATSKYSSFFLFLFISSRLQILMVKLIWRFVWLPKKHSPHSKNLTISSIFAYVRPVPLLIVTSINSMLRICSSWSSWLSMEYKKNTIPLSSDNLLLQVTKIKDTDYVYVLLPSSTLLAMASVSIPAMRPNLVWISPLLLWKLPNSIRLSTIFLCLFSVSK